MKLYHFSRFENLAETGIDPKFHGKGIRGAESKRKKEPNWVDRSYYGTVDYIPETGLGEVKYESEIADNLIYDIWTDVRKIRKNTNSLNEFESAIKELGYFGYRNSGYYGEIVAVFVTLIPVKSEV